MAEFFSFNTYNKYMNNNIIDNNLLLLGRLQGIGSRSSRRILFDLMKKKEGLLKPLIASLQELYDSVEPCSNCYNLDTSNPCYICSNNKRDKTSICIVEDISALWAIEKASEKTNSYNGTYFVLGGTLSANKGADPETLRIPKLIDKIINSNVEEVIFATSATSEGKITSDYIRLDRAMCVLPSTSHLKICPLGLFRQYQS